MTNEGHYATMLTRLLPAGFAALFGAALVPSDLRADAAPDFEVGFDAAELTVPAPGGVIHTQFSAADSVPGVSGEAWRTDGFSSWAQLPFAFDEAAGFGLALWVAIESYPSDLEVPVDRLSPTSIIHQRDQDRGFDLFVDTYGRWGLWLGTDDGSVEVIADTAFPLHRWAQVAVSVDAPDGKATLYLDGATVGEGTFRPGTRIRFAPVDLELARSHSEVGFLNFTFNRLNAAYDELRVYRRALTDDEVRALWARYPTVPDAGPSLAVPESRFAGDFHRPRFHAMPPANWTNEPHGMVRFNGAWHLFYQRTPNGPYKTQMHWGHMMSDDLVTWRNLPDALWPELQTDTFGFDQKGIWSGDVIVDGDRAFAFYTSVNHSQRLSASNPGVAMAVSSDPNLERWRKIGPIINTEHVRDFRDPYLWREDDTWHMLIGATLDTGGGLVYYVLEADDGGSRWVHRPRFSAISYRILDIGSAIWEMPVFEPLNDDVHILLVNPIGGKVTKYGDRATRAIYWTGAWDGKRFRPFDKKPKMLDAIPGHLAPTVARGDDGLLRAIGIVDERRSPQSQEDAGWAHTFSLPRVWRLLDDDRTLGQAPAPELAALRGEPILDLAGDALPDDNRALFSGEYAYELEIELDPSGPPLSIDVMAGPQREEYTRLSFDGRAERIVLDKSNSTTSSEGEGPDVLTGEHDRVAFGDIERVRLYVDGSVVDTFINDAAAFAFRAYPENPLSTGVSLPTDDSRQAVRHIRAWRLRNPP